MGWRDTVGKFFRRQAAGQAAEAARGASGEATMPHALPNSPMDSGGMGSQYLQLATMLSVDADLLLRFADMENMDDYVETCLAGDSLVFVLDTGWVAIRDLAARGTPFWVLAYDRATRSLVPAQATGAWRTGVAGHGKPMVRVVLDDGRSIECTADHRFLTCQSHPKPPHPSIPHFAIPAFADRDIPGRSYPDDAVRSSPAVPWKLTPTRRPPLSPPSPL